jgi:pimeloyl-ACP methyl ester carboxylesterase
MKCAELVYFRNGTTSKMKYVVTWTLIAWVAASVGGAMVPSSSSSMETRVVGSQKCLIGPSRQEQLYPPLVLIGGMAQTIASWQHQIPSLSKNRLVIVYECLGQGKANHNLQDVSLPKQAETLFETLDVIVGADDPVDLVGCSFGGRVGMAAACSQPQRIRKLHLTGVASDRSNFGHLAVEAWKDNIKSDLSLRSFAWSVLLATYSADFLRSQPIERYLTLICETNSPEGLLALLEQAEVSDTADPWHVASMAKRMSREDLDGRICVGELDQMAPVNHVQDLCQQLGWIEPSVIPGCSHAVSLEAGRRWKDEVLLFLND